ncbi:hypothetical protein PENTCL1PPCAC_25455, partial [Pristionchus entomophagus]
SDIDRLPYILSFADDTRSRDRNHPFVRREAANQDGFNLYPLRSLSRAMFVDAHDITDHRPFKSLNEVPQFYDERSNFARVRDRELAFGPDEVRISTDESYEYDPDFYDAIAAQAFDERSRPSTTVTTPRTSTVPPRHTTPPEYLPTATYASFPLRALFPPQFLPRKPVPVFTTTVPPFRILAATTSHPTTVPPHTTTPSTTTMTTTVPTTTTVFIPPTTVPTTTVLPTTEAKRVEPPNTVPPNTIAIESEVTPLLLLKRTVHHQEQDDSPFFRPDIVNSPRRFCRDAIFVLDNSGSTKFNFARFKMIIGNLGDMVLEDSTRRVGLITFSSRHRQRVIIDWSLPRPPRATEDFHRRLTDLAFTGGITQLGAVLHMLQDRLFDEKLQQRARPVDIVLFTDGYSFDDPSVVARNLRMSGHRIYAAALFTGYLRSELDAITGDPARVYTEMEGLDTLAHSLHTCF